MPKTLMVDPGPPFPGSTTGIIFEPNKAPDNRSQEEQVSENTQAQYDQ